MKIVFIGCKNIHALGGIENYMLNLTRELTKLGYECVVWCESDHHEVEWADGVKIIYHPGPKNNLICKPWCGLKATIKTLFHEKNVDIIHYNAWPPSLWSWIPRMFGIKTLMQGHGLEWQRSKFSPIAQKVLKLMEMVTAHTNKHLIMCSQDQTEYFWTKYHRKAITIPTAINLPVEHNNSSDILERFGLETHKYFLFLGRLVQDKNPDYLIRAFRICQHEKFKLVIAGSNDANKFYEESLRLLASNDESIVFTGAVYGADKEKLLSDAYALCIPSTIEGLSIVLLEAMSYKLPIIASSIQANREPLGDNAIWVKPENELDLVNAVEFCINNKEIIQQFVPINFKTVASKYTWDKITNKYVEYLHTILPNAVRYFFGVKFEFSHQALLKIVDEAIAEGRVGYVCALDGNNVATAIENPAHRDVLNGALVNNADSNWATMMINKIYGTHYEHYCSSDMFVDVLKTKKYRQFYLGSSRKVLDALKAQLSEKYDSKIADMPFEELPYCSLDEFDYRGIAGNINRYSPDIIWVSLGAPKQEAFMQNLQSYLAKGVMFGVGAVFNFFSGLDDVEKRAPQWIIHIKLEWLYRLLTQPRKQIRRCWIIMRTLPSTYWEERKKSHQRQ